MPAFTGVYTHICIHFTCICVLHLELRIYRSTIADKWLDINFGTYSWVYSIYWAPSSVTIYITACLPSSHYCASVPAYIISVQIKTAVGRKPLITCEYLATIHELLFLIYISSLSLHMHLCSCIWDTDTSANTPWSHCFTVKPMAWHYQTTLQNVPTLWWLQYIIECPLYIY